MAYTYDRSLQEGTLFEMFEADAYTDTLKALKLAQQEIVMKILSIKGDTWTKRQLTEVRTLIDVEIAKAYTATLSTLQAELPAITSITAQNMLLTQFTKVPTAVLDAVTSNNFEVQGYTAKNLFKTTSDNHARQLRVLVASGVSQGKTTPTIINELIQKNSRLSKGQLKNAIFTTITEARAVSRYDSYDKMQKSGVIQGYEYVAALDSRTTEYCRNHDGRRYYKDIDEIQKYINVHFNCRSIFVPITKSTKIETRASQFGPVPNETYSKWFGRQNESFQRKTLGTNKFNLYKSGSYKIGGLVDATQRVLTLAAIKETLQKTAAEQQILLDAEQKIIDENK